jgi:HAD superfamily hydrolase (TIGR01509 family)
MSFLPLQLVIFDCDGVLVDSEPVSRRVLLAEAARLGITLDDAEADAHTGLRWADVQTMVEHACRHALPASWPLDMQARVIEEMNAHLDAVPGAADLLRATRALGLPYRIASNSSHEEMAAKFALTGLAPLVGARVHSARDVGVGKPAPDVFLAAAAAEGVPPAACLVIEDSCPGVTAAIAAGMRCVAYVPRGAADTLVALGAIAVRTLAEVPPLLEAAMMDRAA